MNKNNSSENISIKNNSLKTINKTVLSEQTQFGLSEIIGIENIFIKKLIKKNHVVKN